MDTGILTATLNKFSSVISLGFASVLPDALHLMNYFVVIEIVVLGVFWALGKGDIIVDAIRKLTLIGFFLFVLSTMKTLAFAILQSFAKIGLAGGGGSVTANDLFDPSKIINFGLEACKPILNAHSSLLEFFIVPYDSFIKLFACFIILLSYALIALQLFITVLEFNILAVAGMILIPFSIFKPLSWLGERAIGAIFSMGVKMMVLAFVISLSYNTLQTLSLPFDTTTEMVLTVMVMSGIIALLCWHAPSIAAQFISGSPTLSFQSFVAPAVAGAMLATTVGARAGGTTARMVNEYKAATAKANNPSPKKKLTNLD
jgi:type IV secretion system protein TrbL